MTNITNSKKYINETLYISSIPELKEDIIKGLKEPVEECVCEEEVIWSHYERA